MVGQPILIFHTQLHPFVSIKVELVNVIFWDISGIPDMSQNMKFTVLSFSNQPGLPKGEIYYIASLSQTAKGGSSDVVQECYEAKIRYHCYCLLFDLKKVPFLGIFGRWLLYIES